MSNNNYSWVETHEQIVEYLKTKENSQKELINLLKSIGISPFNDKRKIGGNNIELNEIDPFTFFCYIYKYGPIKRLRYLQKIAEIINVPIPLGDKGIPSAQAQKVWLFPYKYERVNKEISRLWSFFNKAIINNLDNISFEDVLKIKGVGKTKLTESLFYINPRKYLPINGPTKPYIKEVLNIDPNFTTYLEYIYLLNKIKEKTSTPFYELSHIAWEWTEKHDNILKNKYSSELINFLNQAKTGNLKTKHFIKTFNNTKVKVSFGQGVSARIPWISFLIKPFSTSKGIYPVYLFYKNINKLVLAYGVSETNKPEVNWDIDNPKKIKNYFNEKELGKPDRYGDSFLFKIYDTNNLPNKTTLDDDLNKIIKQYLSIDIKESKQPIMNSNTSIVSFFNNSCTNSNLKYLEPLTTRYISSLVTKPFVLLSGLSGSGKTKLAQAFAQWICKDSTQYKIVPVGADWTNREPLLGYANALNKEEYILPENGALELIIEANKDENKDKPYFLILDEMNLSHVERYFADFLSVMESKESIKLHSSGTLTSQNGIEIKETYKWPKNLFVVGTVNIDETTYMFSPKVLDRANVIEFRVNKEEIEDFLDKPNEIDLEKLETKGESMATAFVAMAKNKEFESGNTTELNKKLVAFFEELKKAGAEFGYRTAMEIHRLYNQLSVINSNISENDKIDIAIMQKLLPKLHGSSRKLKPILEVLAKICVADGVDYKKDFFENNNEVEYTKTDVLFKLSLEKITRMYKNAIQNGFASYAEA